MKYNKNWLFLVGFLFIFIVRAYQGDELAKRTKLETDITVRVKANETQQAKNQKGCQDPTDFELSNLTDTQVIISWEANGEQEWEYFVQDEGIGLPPATGAPQTQNPKVTVTETTAGIPFLPQTLYEYYVRVRCADGTTASWLGPYFFTTACTAIATFPFIETFNSNTTTFDCWNTIEDGFDHWERIGYSAYEGNGVMNFYSDETTEVYDNWLISPAFRLKATAIYELSFYVSGGTYDLLLSTNGSDPSSFTTVLAANQAYSDSDYIKLVYVLTGYDETINIAWRVKSKEENYLFVDLVQVEEVACIAPNQNTITISQLTSLDAVISWEDSINSQWEYVVVPADSGLPTSSGVLTNQKSQLINTLTGGGNLQPDTAYDFYLRSTCNGTDKSSWVGPIAFKTLCANQVTPFFEGFNTGSPTFGCWTMTYGQPSSTSVNVWRRTTVKHEGTHSMYYYGNSRENLHDAWLISPSIGVSANTYYRISYYYRTMATYSNDFEVRLSTNGVDIANFTTLLDTKTKEANNTFVKQSYIIAGFNGSVHIGWHVNGKDSGQYLYIDAVTVEEITCPEPSFPIVSDINQTDVTIRWQDAFNTNWEYVVQEEGVGAPLGSGMATTQISNLITADAAGKTMEQNKGYEYYVRSQCASGEFSEWIGPILFRTACDPVALPFWEGFNDTSSSFYCWEISNQKVNQAAATWKQYNRGMFEGSHAMYLNYFDFDNEIEANDWLISPTFTFDATKVYRLSYQYKTSSDEEENNTFEVLASTKGTDVKNFTTEIVKSQQYTNNQYKEEIQFISNLGGAVNLAWHATGIGAKTIYIDAITIEEVQNCPEPLNITVSAITENQANVTWIDDFSTTSWEYVVQLKDAGLPIAKGVNASSKSVTVTHDYSGVALTSNTEYEVYVRTVCPDGSYSKWAGPVSFITTCGVFPTPLWEGFNSGTVSQRCWQVMNQNGDESSWKIEAMQPYEGDQVMWIQISDNWDEIDSDDWLITPRFATKAGMYVLKYHYASNSSNVTNLEILLSSSGDNPADFTQVIHPKTTYDNDEWLEKVIFFTAPTGISNIAFRVTGVGSQVFFLDNVVVKEAGTCPEPYYVEVTNQTLTSVDLTWQQDGGITSWEVIVVPYAKDEEATPLQTLTVTGNPTVSVTGLQEGTPYTFYVRAQCTAANSLWSTPVHTSTEVGANDECTGAISIPVNSTLTCKQTVSGSIWRATLSNRPFITCQDYTYSTDVWFEFIATNRSHRISVLDFISLSDEKTMVAGLYNQPCTTLQIPLKCGSFSVGKENKWDITDLVPGQKYYLRFGAVFENDPNYLFNLCIGTPEEEPMEVDPSGHLYSVEELVKEVFVNSTCDLVSNIHYQVGDGSAATQGVNTLGYFNKGKSLFPFEEGIVLSTGEVNYVAGPFIDDQNSRGNNPHRWTGDQDLNDAINDAGGNPEKDGSMRVTQLEFDFIPIKDSISFEYLFASNSYVLGCNYTCMNGALFAAWLIDTTTGEGQNLAKIKGSDTPISLGNIWDSSKIKGTACTTNEAYFWNNYTSHKEPLHAPFNFAGSTIAMTSETVHLVPGRKYHIKLAVMDFCTNQAHTSAVFFNAGSFNLGGLDLGKDLTIANENALCADETRALKSGLTDDQDVMEITWFKDGVELEGEKTPDLAVSESGIYRVSGYYKAIDCEVTGEIKVELYPAIHMVVYAPQDLAVCRFVTTPTPIDLTAVVPAMFAREGVNLEDYTLTFYLDQEKENTIEIPTQFNQEEERERQEIFVEVVDERTGCMELFSFYVVPTAGEIPTTPQDVLVCGAYVLPSLSAHQAYYTEAGGKGMRYQGGDLLGPGQYTLYVHQNNGSTCFEEVVFQVDVTAPIEILTLPDTTLACSFFELPPLPDNHTYWMEDRGKLVEVNPGTAITTTNTRIYIKAVSPNQICEAESSFVINYEDCPIPRGFSPNGDGVNDTFDLSQHGVTNIQIFNRQGVEVYSFNGIYTNQWDGRSSGGKNLPSGTYYYVIRALDKTRTGWVQLNR